MSLGKILLITALALLSIIGIAVVFKNSSQNIKELPIDSDGRAAAPLSSEIIHKNSLLPVEIALEEVPIEVVRQEPIIIQPVVSAPPVIDREEPLSEVDRIDELFSIKGSKLPFIETITYKSRVAWQKGRPAWLSDYASHYGTSRHFIARSLNGKPDYFKQEIAEGNKFNVFKQDFPLEFQLVIDISRCKMWFYALSGEQREKILLKTYKVSLGRPDTTKDSGLLTPLGKYQLGNRIAIYKPQVMGHYKGQKVEMIQVFGTRWIPFEKVIGEASAPAKGFGLHGVPWVKNKKGEIEEDISSLGGFESDGCVRMETDAIEAIYAIVITKPAFVELVKDFSQSELFTK